MLFPHSSKTRRTKKLKDKQEKIPKNKTKHPKWHFDNILKVKNWTKPHGLGHSWGGSGRNSLRGDPTALPPRNVEPGLDLSSLNTTPEESPIDPHHPQTALNDYPRAQAELGLGCGQQLCVPTSGIDFGDLFGATRCQRCLCSYLEFTHFYCSPGGVLHERTWGGF